MSTKIGQSWSATIIATSAGVDIPLDVFTLATSQYHGAPRYKLIVRNNGSYDVSINPPADIKLPDGTTAGTVGAQAEQATKNGGTFVGGPYPVSEGVRRLYASSNSSCLVALVPVLKDS